MCSIEWCIGAFFHVSSFFIFVSSFVLSSGNTTQPFFVTRPAAAVPAATAAGGRCPTKLLHFNFG